MKFLICGDVHWSQYSSIVRGNGDKYSTRLENLITVIQWAEDYAVQTNCDVVLYLGDFFDKTQLNAMEISALKEIKWANMPHMFLVGNHEINTNANEYSTTDIFSLLPNASVISHPITYELPECNLMMLPYINNSSEYKFNYPILNKPLYGFSHNDISGIQMGRIISREGFNLNEISSKFNLFFNGHLHNGVQINNTVYNVGNLTGQNFSEDAFEYRHKVYTFDTVTREVFSFEVPDALNFVKLDFTSCSDDKYLRSTLCNNHLKNTVCMITCKDTDVKKVTDCALQNPDIVTYRILTTHTENNANTEPTHSLSNIDYIKMFEEYVLTHIGNSEIVKSELAEIMK